MAEQKAATFSTPYQFNAKELDSETGLYNYGARYYDPKLSLWTGVDPLADKNNFESPYIYVSNNPIKFIDPDGKEKIIGYNSKSKKDDQLRSAANSDNDDGAIHIFAHGDSEGIVTYNDGERNVITDSEGLSKFLDKHSETWKNRSDGEELTIVLHSCRAGKCDNADDSFLDELSFSDEFEDVNLVGADSFVWADDSGEIGTYDVVSNKNGSRKTTKNGSTARGEPGNWRVTKNGVNLTTYSADWKPKEKPTLWDRLFKEN